MFPFPVLATAVPPAICTVAIWKNPFLTSGSITSVCPKTVYPLAPLFGFQKQCDFCLGLLEILPNNQNKQGYVSLRGESGHICNNAPQCCSIICSFFVSFCVLFFLQSCLIQLLFNVFMTTACCFSPPPSLSFFSD